MGHESRAKKIRRELSSIFNEKTERVFIDHGHGKYTMVCKGNRRKYQDLKKALFK